METEKIAQLAKEAFIKTMQFDNKTKNSALKKIVDLIIEKKDEIFKANNNDLLDAKIMLEKGELTKASFDRLKFDETKLNSLTKGILDLIKLNDPVNNVIFQKELDKGLILKKVSTPIGVIGVIFEARPDCFPQIASLLIKSGNTGILKGGREAKNTNTVFSEIFNEALEKSNYPKNTINLIYERDDVKKLLDLDNYISLIIPRGSNKLVQYIKENTKIPVLGHSSGICHIFVDKSADYLDAFKIIVDAKTQYPSACNAVETVLIHNEFKEIEKLKGSLIKEGIKVIENPESFEKEYSDKILAFKIVKDIKEAINHINSFGSGHTDCIISKDKENIEKFMDFVDSSSVFANCSTRFSDGFRYGFGAEVGISTAKIHARGPVGLDGLTIYKYKLYGSNDIVLPYVTGEKNFTHKDLKL